MCVFPPCIIKYHSQHNYLKKIPNLEFRFILNSESSSVCCLLNCNFIFYIYFTFYAVPIIFSLPFKVKNNARKTILLPIDITPMIPYPLDTAFPPKFTEICSTL